MKIFFNCLKLVILPIIISLQTVYSQQSAINSTTADDLLILQKQVESKSCEWNLDSVNLSIKEFVKISGFWKEKNLLENAAFNLRQAGSLNAILGKNQEAHKLLVTALNLAESPQNTDERIKILSELTLLSISSGKIPSAQKYLNESIFLSGKTGSYSAKAYSTYSDAEFHYYQRNLDEAINLYSKALMLAKKANDRKIEAKITLYLGYGYLYHDEVNLGYQTLLDALNVYQELGDKRGLVFTQIAIGNALAFMDKRQQALVYYKNANSVFPSDIDFVEKARLNNGIASIFEQYEDWITALTYREKALDLFRRGNHKYGELATLSGIGKLYAVRGDYTSAFKTFSESEKIADILNDKFYLALIQAETGKLYFQAGENKKALKHYQKSLNIFKSINEKKQIGLIYDEVGNLYASEKDFQNSFLTFQKALEIHQQVKNSFAVSQTFYNLSKLHSFVGEKQALNLIVNSINTTESLYSEVLNSKLKSTYFSTVFDRYELYINLLMKNRSESPNEDYAIQALQAAEKSRARSMLENLSLAEANFIKDASPEVVRREKEIRVLLNSKADKLTDLLSGNADKIETDKLDNEINELEHELEEIKATLKQNSPIYSAIKNPAPFDVGEFQRDVLDENSVLLEFSFGKDESYLWFVGKTEVAAYVLPSREQIESSVEKLRRLIDSRQPLADETVEDYQARITAAEAGFEIEAADFSRVLLGQVAGNITGKRLIIVPDGKLHYFPIAALPFPGSVDNTPILLTNETIYEPSAATLALLMRNGRKTSAATKNLLVFSDPIFSEQDVRTAANGGIENQIAPADVSRSAEKSRFAESLTSLVRLNATRDEADAIIEIVGESDSTALSGAAATREAALDASLADYKIIHFATHGLINEERPELSGIVLSQVDGNGESRNGVVRLQDIYAMNLAADAVVLSACSTGIGKEVKGEGLMSLNNAFLQTGAKSVVSSLWKVEDHAAQELMKDFYRELSSGTATTAEALRKAQIKMRRNPQYQSPFYWAAFTVEGDFQNVPRILKSFDYRIYGLLIFPFALLTLLAFRRFNLLNRKIKDKS